MKQLPIITDLSGRVLTFFDLPPATEKRWTVNKKAVVVRAVEADMLTLEEAMKRYSLSRAEFNSWRMGLETHGAQGLMITKSLGQHAAISAM